MYWSLLVIGQACVIAAAMFCMAREKKPLKLLAGATTAASATLVTLLAMGLVSALSSRSGWPQIAPRWFGIGAAFLGSTVFGALAGVAVVALVAEPAPARSNAYVGALIGLAVAAVPVVFLQETWPAPVRSAVVIALLCQGFIAGTLTGRARGARYAL